MCGIVGYVGKNKNSLNVLIDGLERLEYRGYDSAGVAYVSNNELFIKKYEGRISNLKNNLDFKAYVLAYAFFVKTMRVVCYLARNNR